MGYNTWNDFRCNDISAANVMAVADKMVELGLDKVGYEYVNIDDCWAVGREPNGTLIPDPAAFPDGMKAVADYVHSKGFKFGIYTDRGNLTCAGRPGAGGHEVLDANTFASWGVDYLKEDSCNATQVHEEAFAEYGVMRDALNQTGRHIYFSLCGWNSWYSPVGYTLGNSWRISGDCNKWLSIVKAIIVNQALSHNAQPGGWNDPDMLVGSSPKAAVFNTPAQSRTQFSLWAIMAAPLLIGSNMLNMTAYDLETYSNSEVIAVDQDPLGAQGRVLWENCPMTTLEDARHLSAIPNCQQVWAKPLSNGSYAVAFVNYDIVGATTVCGYSCLAEMGMRSASIRDLWAHEDLGTFTTFTVQLAADGASQTYLFTKAS